MLDDAGRTSLLLHGWMIRGPLSAVVPAGWQSGAKPDRLRKPAELCPGREAKRGSKQQQSSDHRDRDRTWILRVSRCDFLRGDPSAEFQRSTASSDTTVHKLHLFGAFVQHVLQCDYSQDRSRRPLRRGRKCPGGLSARLLHTGASPARRYADGQGS